MAIQIDQAEINSIRLKEQAVDVASTDSGYGQLYVKNDGVYFKATGTTYMLKDVGARVYNSTQVTVTGTGGVGTVATVIPFDSERWDTDTIHDTVTNNSRLTCNTPGKYMIYGNVTFNANGGDEGYRSLEIRLNGSTADADVLAKQASKGISGVAVNMTISTIWGLDSGDYVELLARQRSGSNILIGGASTVDPHELDFGMQKID